MRSAELVTQPTELEKLIDIGVASTDMTLIYNAHGTPEDAVASVKHVEPDSVVFIEGYSTRKTNEDSGMFDLSYEPYLTALNELRLQYGKNHEDYQQFKESILASIESMAAQYVPRDGSDFTLHKLAEIKELLKKDCLVLYADYRNLSAEQNGQEKVNGHDQQFQNLVQEATTSGLADISGDSMGNALRSLRSGVGAEILKHNHREKHAVVWSLSTMGQIATALPADAMDLRRSDSGKINAYNIFGTAHAKSLTGYFTDEGVEPTVIMVEPLAEHLYLDKVSGAEYKNFERRIGHAALGTIAYYMTHEFVLPALLEDTYNHLEFLNKAGQEERLGFLVTCIHIQKLLGQGDRKTAEKEYLALMRSFMPHSVAFKPPTHQTIYAMPPSMHKDTAL